VAVGFCLLGLVFLGLSRGDECERNEGRPQLHGLVVLMMQQGLFCGEIRFWQSFFIQHNQAAAMGKCGLGSEPAVLLQAPELGSRFIWDLVYVGVGATST
jgi:hypothetical protein